MEPTEVAHLEGSDRFHAAAELSDRFLDNIESVVHGKRDEIKLVLAALLESQTARLVLEGADAVGARHRVPRAGDVRDAFVPELVQMR